jgi:hypothetical protein
MDKDIHELQKNYGIMNNEMKNMSEGIKNVDKKLESYIVEDREWKEKFTKDLRGQFAGKWVESVLLYVIGGTAVSILVWLIAYK